MLRARLSTAMWVVVAIAIPLGAVLAVACLILPHGWGKLLGVGVLFFFILSVMAAVGFGTVWIDETALEARCILGRYRIRWDEVQRLWHDGSELNLLLEGHGKRVAVPGYSLWKSPDKAEMVDVMTRKLKEYGVESKRSGLKTLLLSNRAAKVLE